MRAISIALITLASLSLSVFAQAQSKTLKPTEIGADHVGKDVAVVGRIYQNNMSKSGIHLYFGADMSTSFQAIIPNSSKHKFKVDIQKKFNQRNVRVTGKVAESGGRYYIRVDEPKQIKVVPRKRRSTS